MVLINSVIGKLLLVLAYLILKEIGDIVCNGVYAICLYICYLGENCCIYCLYLYSCCKVAKRLKEKKNPNSLI